MADHTTTIAQLEAILNSGARSGTVDGHSVSFQTADEIRKRIAELQAADDSNAGRRPRAPRITLGGF